jgi:hypothetical protein
MKTSELQGAALDWAVAKADGLEFEVMNGSVFIPDWEGVDDPYKYQPSTVWDDGGPIIERESIQLWVGQQWNASMEPNNINPAEFESGPTPLIAAMRCYVASQLGDEVSIPEGLV